MNPDLILTIGLILGALSVPAIMAAVSDGRAPRAPMLTILIAGGLILAAFYLKPGGYRMEEIPDAFFGVIGSFTN